MLRSSWPHLSRPLSASCGRRPAYVSVDGVMLGTTLHVAADVRGVSPQELYAAVMELDREAKASMSIYDPASLLSRLNRNETDSVDRHIAFNLRLADSIGSLSGGRYDVTVKPLVEAWGFAGKERVEHPNVDSILEFVGREKVRIEAGRLVKDDPRVQLDFNSVAKGYVVDLLAGAGRKIRRRELYRRCRRRGPLPGRQPAGRRVAHRHRNPLRRQHDRTVSTSRNGCGCTDGGLATSGNYRRFYLDAEGNKIAHTIDPRTGCSAVSRLLSVTVAAPTCAEADALGTMFLAMGADDALAAAAAMPGGEGLFHPRGRRRTNTRSMFRRLWKR